MLVFVPPPGMGDVMKTSKLLNYCDCYATIETHIWHFLNYCVSWLSYASCKRFAWWCAICNVFHGFGYMNDFIPLFTYNGRNWKTNLCDWFQGIYHKKQSLHFVVSFIWSQRITDDYPIIGWHKIDVSLPLETENTWFWVSVKFVKTNRNYLNTRKWLMGFWVMCLIVQAPQV